MRRQIVYLAVAGAVLAMVAAGPPGQPEGADEEAAMAATAAEKMKDPAYVLGFRMPRLNGEQEWLSKYEGKVVVIVNVASECGLTPQYAGLEELFRLHKDAGLVVLGFPANNFGRQEPGTNEQIAEFCTGRYGVTFPMFEKVSVKGDDRHPLFGRLAGQPEPIGGEPKWNFNKFIVDRSGRVVARFEPAVRPDDAKIVAKIEELLKAPSAAGKE